MPVNSNVCGLSSSHDLERMKWKMTLDFNKVNNVIPFRLLLMPIIPDARKLLVCPKLSL